MSTLLLHSQSHGSFYYILFCHALALQQSLIGGNWVGATWDRICDRIRMVITQMMRALIMCAISSAFIFDIRRGQHGRQAYCTTRELHSQELFSSRDLALNMLTLMICRLCQILLCFMKPNDIHSAEKERNDVHRQIRYRNYDLCCL